MLVEVKVPQLSESVTEATLVTWRRKAGDYVVRDENLVDIETDKVALETPAPESGGVAGVIHIPPANLAQVESLFHRPDATVR